jgi:predicted metal-dependent peptidase
LPSVSGEALGDVVVAVDCSGSVTLAETQAFAAEMRGVKEDGNPQNIYVVYFTDRVNSVESFSRDEPLMVAPNYTGGTAFSPIFAEIADRGIEPSACVVLTDLYCNDFGPQPEYPVLWVTNGETKAPWGEVVEMK